MRVVEGQTDDVLAASDVVITASGTATVQAALHGKPMVVVYRLSPVTYKLGKPLVRVPMYSMVNLVAGERVVEELIQDACTPEAVAREAVDLLTNAERVAEMKEQLAIVRSGWAARAPAVARPMRSLEVVAPQARCRGHEGREGTEHPEGESAMKHRCGLALIVAVVFRVATSMPSPWCR